VLGDRSAVIEADLDDDDRDVLRIDAHPVDAPDADAAVLHRRADLEPRQRHRRLLVADRVAVALGAELQAGEEDEAAEGHEQAGADEDAEAELLGAGHLGHRRTSRADGSPRSSPAATRWKKAWISGSRPSLTSASVPSAMTLPRPSMSARSAMRSMLMSSWVTTTMAMPKRSRRRRISSSSSAEVSGS